jgi:D-alanine transaminase
MTRIVYLNGEWLPETEAKISVFDRGYTMGDAIYEVTCVLDGKLADYAPHAARLQRSARELQLVLPLSDAELLAVHRQIITLNTLREGMIYLQLSRSATDREFTFARGAISAATTLVIYTQAKNAIDNPAAETGIDVISLPDLRWGRRDIKTVQLLWPSLAKMEAVERGAQDAWLTEDGFVTEASAASAHILTAEGVLVTRDLSQAILPGVTRAAALELARRQGIKVEERPFTLHEALVAREAFITSATNFVLPVVRIDGTQIGTGTPGPVARELRRLYIETRRASLI